MEKIPCIECDSQLWKYIKPYLKEWGYCTTPHAADRTYCSILILNWNGEIGHYGFGVAPFFI